MDHRTSFRPAVSTRRQRGAALVMAMLVMALAAVAAAALLTRMDDWLQAVARRHERAQTLELARGGIAYGRAVLTEDARNSGIDHGEEGWARRLPTFAAEGGELAGEIEDLQGRFNLNNLVEDGKIDEAALAEYRRLLGFLDLDPPRAETLLQSLADWLDGDDRTRPGGGEHAYYQSLSPPRPAGNRPLERLEDLLRIKDYDPALLRLLAPHVTVLPLRSAINVNTAPPAVLAAVVPGLTLAEARALAAARRPAWFRDEADFRSRLPRQDLPVGANRLSVASSFFLIRSRARFGAVDARIEALVDRRRGGGFPEVIWQSEQ